MRNWTSTLVAVVLSGAWLLSCGPKQGPREQVPLIPGEQSAASHPQTAVPVDDGPPLRADRGELFVASGACQECHDNIQGDVGQDVSVPNSWRATMMANAARDPYYLATVSSEVAFAPALAAIIEDKCSTCHMPMARFTDVAKGGKGSLFEGYLDPKHPLHGLADDGVSCTACHQLSPEGIGAPASYSGHLRYDFAQPDGDRVAHGVHDVKAADIAQMREASGYRPVKGEHMGKSEVCAGCHTLFTPFLDNAGKVAGEMPEQTPYLEWQKSGWPATHQCQDCHMPPTRRNGRRFYQHHFAGGNVWMLKVLAAGAEEMGVTASASQLEASILRNSGQLEMAAAELTLASVALQGSKLTAQLIVRPRTGHKLPTAYPSRRVWLRVTVADGAGNLLFESGKAGADGAIVGNDNDADGKAFEPHHATITAADQVQIYESVMVDVDGAVTTQLLRGARYIKDNRLLPRGLEPSELGPAIAVHGGASTDPDFRAGSDQVRYEIAVAGAVGPLTFTAELCYQSVGYRWRENLRGVDSDHVRAFFAASDKVPNQPIVLARVSRLVK